GASPRSPKRCRGSKATTWIGSWAAACASGSDGGPDAWIEADHSILAAEEAVAYPRTGVDSRSQGQRQERDDGASHCRSTRPRSNGDRGEEEGAVLRELIPRLISGYTADDHGGLYGGQRRSRPPPGKARVGAHLERPLQLQERSSARRDFVSCRSAKNGLLLNLALDRGGCKGGKGQSG